MQWSRESLKQYVDAQEYIDTLLIPLVPLKLKDVQDLEKNAFQRELLNILSNEIERELAGRIMLLPEYVYLANADLEQECERLNSWIQAAKNQPFEHILFLTFDVAWKQLEDRLEGHLLWLTSMQTGNLKSKEMHGIVKEQVQQIITLIRTYWN